MKLFKKKDKNIEAEENLAKNAESAKTAADGKNAGAAQETKEDVPETIVCPKCGKTVLKSVVKQHKYVCYECNYYFRVRAKNRIRMVSDKEAFEPWFTHSCSSLIIRCSSFRLSLDISLFRQIAAAARFIFLARFRYSSCVHALCF